MSSWSRNPLRSKARALAISIFSSTPQESISPVAWRLRLPTFVLDWGSQDLCCFWQNTSESWNSTQIASEMIKLDHEKSWKHRSQESNLIKLSVSDLLCLAASTNDIQWPCPKLTTKTPGLPGGHKAVKHRNRNGWIGRSQLSHQLDIPKHNQFEWLQSWPFTTFITSYFNGIIHSRNI